MSIKIKFKKSYPSFNLDVDAEIPATGITALFGPSGCGKTTLLRAMTGLEKCEFGLFSINGKNIQDQTNFMDTPERQIGYVFQEATLFPHLSVEKNLKYGYERIPAEREKPDFEHIIDVLGLKSFLGRMPDNLSGGEKQRVAIGRALLTNPQILLMDEPLTGLDMSSKKEIYPFLLNLKNDVKLPIIYVSHSSDEVARLADTMMSMQQGKITASGPISEMLTRSDLKLAHRSDAEAIIVSKVSGYDKKYHLTFCDFPGGRFYIPENDLEPGQEVRLRVLARDVSLTLEKQTETSILNIFPVRVDELIEKNDARITVHLSANGVPLLSRITKKSAEILNLEVGKKVYAQVKSVAVLA